MLVLMKGAGDIATGIALRLWRARFQVVMTEIALPTTVRRTVSFSQAIFDGTATVEGVKAVYAPTVEAAWEVLDDGLIPVLIDPEAACRFSFYPDALVDAIMAKQNRGTTIRDASVVIGLGPGFTAGLDCHAVIETSRGHDLGRVITSGNALPNTGVPAEVGGHSIKRVLRAPAEGLFREGLDIGTRVQPGDVIGKVDHVPVISEIEGILRGVLADGVPVVPGMKCGDVDPRCEPAHCHTVSDKARAIAGGVLEAILRQPYDGVTPEGYQSDRRLTYAALMGIAPGDVVSIIGSGGKTSLLCSLNLELIRDNKVLVSTTTKMYGTYMQSSTHLLFGPEIDGKMTAPPMEQLAAAVPTCDITLLECDGAKELPLKGWADHEPVVPDFTTVTVGVLPLWALGYPINPQTVHRMEEFCRMTGAKPGELVRIEHLAAVIGHPRGLFQKARGRRILFLNTGRGSLGLWQARTLLAQLGSKTLAMDISMVLAADTNTLSAKLLWTREGETP